MVTPLGRAVEFFRDFGLFDIVLPFLLVFAIVFAVLEKTRIFRESFAIKRAESFTLKAVEPKCRPENR